MKSRQQIILSARWKLLWEPTLPERLRDVDPLTSECFCSAGRIFEEQQFESSMQSDSRVGGKWHLHLVVFCRWWSRSVPRLLMKPPGINQFPGQSPGDEEARTEIHLKPDSGLYTVHIQLLFRLSPLISRTGCVCTRKAITAAVTWNKRESLGNSAKRASKQEMILWLESASIQSVSALKRGMRLN